MGLGADVLVLILPFLAALAIVGILIWAAMQFSKGYPTERDITAPVIALQRKLRRPPEVPPRRDESDPPRGAA